jgi:hypothetical protein
MAAAPRLLDVRYAPMATKFCSRKRLSTEQYGWSKLRKREKCDYKKRGESKDLGHFRHPVVVATGNLRTAAIWPMPAC